VRVKKRNIVLLYCKKDEIAGQARNDKVDEIADRARNDKAGGLRVEPAMTRWGDCGSSPQ
jgi:hypothetical protein